MDSTDYFEGNYKLSAMQDPKTGEWMLLRDSKYEVGRIKDKIVTQHIIKRFNNYQKEGD